MPPSTRHTQQLIFTSDKIQQLITMLQMTTEPSDYVSSSFAGFLGISFSSLIFNFGSYHMISNVFLIVLFQFDVLPPFRR